MVRDKFAMAEKREREREGGRERPGVCYKLD
jgi:hypothetical protein